MIQIDMQMPEGCSECRFETERGFCKAMPDDFCGYTNDEGIPEWCPLKGQEQKPVADIADSVDGIEVGRCPSCDRVIVNKKSDPTRYCKFCGQEVKWDA